MKYIHGGYIKKRSVGGAVVRVVFGSILLFFAIFICLVGFLSGEFSNQSEDTAPLFVMIFLFFLPGGLALFITGLVSLSHSTTIIPRHDLSAMLPMDMNNPFFTCQCERCGLVFDYQFSDLGYRAWYPSGYTDCPRCENHIRHNATTNTFRSDEHLF